MNTPNLKLSTSEISLHLNIHKYNKTYVAENNPPKNLQ